MSRYRISSAISHLRRNDLEVVSSSYCMHIWFEVRATACESLSAAVRQRKFGLHAPFGRRLTDGPKHGIRLRW